jgi:hypothetical protein
MPHKIELWLQGLKQGRAMRLRALGGSMTPWLRSGDIVTIVPGNSARLGEVVLTHGPSGLLLHRLVLKSARRVVTKGDRLPCLDPPVSPYDILGRAVARQRHDQVRSLVSFAARFCGLGLSLTLPWALKYFPGIVALKRFFPGGLRSETEYATLPGQG